MLPKGKNTIKILIFVITLLVVTFTINFVYNSIKTTSYHSTDSYVSKHSNNIDLFRKDYDPYLLYHDLDSCKGFSYSELLNGELALQYQIRDTNVYLLHIPLELKPHIDISIRKVPPHVHGLFMNPFKGLNAVVYYNLDYERSEEANNRLRILSDTDIIETENSFNISSPHFLEIKNKKQTLFYVKFNSTAQQSCKIGFSYEGIVVRIYSL